MTVLGIDPGLERIGYGVVQKNGSRLVCVEHGLITTPRIATPMRLEVLFRDVCALIERAQPDCVSTERLFFSKNQTTAIDVAKALGVVQLACAQRGLDCTEYSPPEIKLSVVGHGGAEKRQVEFMVTKLLGLAQAPTPDDVADALAIAVTHALRQPGTVPGSRTTSEPKSPGCAAVTGADKSGPKDEAPVTGTAPKATKARAAGPAGRT